MSRIIVCAGIVLPPPEDPHQASSEPHSEAVANQGEPIQGSIQAVALEWGQEGFERWARACVCVDVFFLCVCAKERERERERESGHVARLNCIPACLRRQRMGSLLVCKPAAVFVPVTHAQVASVHAAAPCL